MRRASSPGFRDAKIHRTAMPYPLSIKSEALGSALARVKGKRLKREAFKGGPLSRKQIYPLMHKQPSSSTLEESCY